MDTTLPVPAPETITEPLGSGQGPGCSMGKLLHVLAGPWTLHIVWVLSTMGPCRFGSLRRTISGISSKMLTDRLRLLEQEGFIYREFEATIPPRVTYGLTARGAELDQALGALNAVASRWYPTSPQP